MKGERWEKESRIFVEKDGFCPRDWDGQRNREDERKKKENGYEGFHHQTRVPEVEEERVSQGPDDGDRVGGGAIPVTVSVSKV